MIKFNIMLILLVYKRLFSQQDGGVLRGISGVKLSTCPSQSHIHTRRALFALRCPFDIDTPLMTTKPSKSGSKRDIQTLEGHKPNISFAVFQLTLPIIVIGCEGGTI